MGTVINLGRYRKAKQAAERERRANERRFRFGMPRTERDKSAAEQRLETRRHDGHRFDDRSSDRLGMESDANLIGKLQHGEIELRRIVGCIR